MCQYNKICLLLLIALSFACNKKKVTVTGTAYDINTGAPLPNFNITASTIVSQKQHEFPEYQTYTDANAKFTFNKIRYGTDWPTIGFGTKNENYFCMSKAKNFSKHTKKITQDLYFTCNSTLNLTIIVGIMYFGGEVFIDALSNNSEYNFRQSENFGSPNYFFQFTKKIASGYAFSNVITVRLYDSSQNTIKEQSVTLNNILCGSTTSYTVNIN